MFEDSDKLIDGPSCPSCGSIADAEDKFCDVCGASIFGGDKQGGLLHALRRNQVLKFGIGGVVVSVLAIVAVASFSGFLSKDANSRETADRKESSDTPAASTSGSLPKDASSQGTANDSATLDAPAVAATSSPTASTAPACETGLENLGQPAPAAPANDQYRKGFPSDETTKEFLTPKTEGGINWECIDPVAARAAAERAGHVNSIITGNMR